MIDRLRYILLAKRSGYQIRERRLMQDLARELDARCYVSFSAGKDSSVIAHACHAVRPGIPMFMAVHRVPPSAEFPESEEGVPTQWMPEERDMWLEYARMEGWNLSLVSWEKWIKERPKDLDAYRASVHAEQFTGVRELAARQGCTRRIMGLRADESPTRRMSLGRDKGSSALRLCPISLWNTDDVWCYIVSKGLPWLSIYDHCGPAARNGLIGRNGAERGRHEFLRRHYPAAFRLARELLHL